MEYKDLVDEIFGGVEEYYPGSRRKRRALDPVAVAKKNASMESWDSHGQKKTLPNGTVVDLFSAGALGSALNNRPLVTIRLWERKGYIPRAPYRLRSMLVNGVKKPGWRMYSREMIESTILSFQSRGLLDAPRIDWDRHTDLSIELMENWTKIHKKETT